jgi:hypothetical protein
MTANINEDELRLLAYLHEHAEGYDGNFAFEPENVASALNFEMPAMKKNSSYLAAHGLVGMSAADTTTMTARGFIFVTVWLTGLGEDYMRALEKEPSVGRKLTVGAVSQMWDAGKGIIVSTAAQLLAEYVKHYHR